MTLAAGAILLWISGLIALPKNVDANASDINRLQESQIKTDLRLQSVEKDVQYIREWTDKVSEKLGVM